MSLINYVEPINVGGVFVGIGGLILTGVIAYVIYRIYIKFAQYIDVVINRESKYELYQEAYLDELAGENGIDLQKKLLERNMLNKPTKSIRKRIEDQLFKRMFDEEE